ncbi:MAG: hypothetical protein K2N56_03140 [Oscillospiraceae bacterium]|nr:hypothetical protein [Oscillospiraceae bacterium]
MIIRKEIDFSKPLTEEQLKMLDALEQMDDSEIDYSDIPEMTDEDWDRTVRVRDILKGDFVNLSGEKLSRAEAEMWLTHFKHIEQLSDSEYAALYAKLPPEDPKAAGA